MSANHTGGQAAEPPDSAPWSKVVFAAGAALVLTLAAAVRFYRLDSAPIWMDEAFTQMASRLPASTLLYGNVDVHPPLFYLIQHFWHALDPDLSALRVPAAVLGVIAVLVTIFAGRDLVSPRAGLAAGALLALNTGHIYFSQDARMYTLMSLGVATWLWGMAGLLTRDRVTWRYGALYVAGAIVSAYAQVISLVVLAAPNLVIFGYALLRLRLTRPELRLLAANALVLLSIIPCLIHVVIVSSVFPGLKSYPATTAIWFFNNMIGFPGVPPAQKGTLDFSFDCILLIGSVGAWRLGRRVMLIVTLAVLLLYPLGLLVVSLRDPVLENRMFIPCSIAVSWLFGLTVDAFGRIAGAAVLSFALACSAFSSAYELGHRIKPQNDPAALQIADRLGASSAPIYTCGFLDAASAQASAPSRDVYFFSQSVPIRVDDRAYLALGMSINTLFSGDPKMFARFTGEPMQPAWPPASRQTRVVLISAVCDPSAVRALLGSSGFVAVPTPQLAQPRHAIFNTVWTRVEVWRQAQKESDPSASR